MLETSSTLLKTWEYKNQKVSVYWKDDKAIFVLDNSEVGQKIIHHYNITGIPSDIKKDRDALSAFLDESYIIPTESSSGDLKLSISLSLKGGANIIDPRREPNKLWSGAVVPFEIDSTKYPVAKKEREVILQAIKEFNQSNTGFTLIPRTDQTDYLIFGEEDGVCYSNVGRRGGAQYIRCDLDGGGFNKRSVKHEMMHAIGFYHEHQRADRDEYVVVTSDDATNYGREGNTHGDYDFNSIMHYYLGGELRVHPSLELTGEELVGMQDRLSEGDVAAAQFLARHARPQAHLRPALISGAVTTQGTSVRYPHYFRARQPEHEKLQLQAERLCERGYYSEAYKLYAALIREYHKVSTRECVSNWANQCGVCMFRLGEYAFAKQKFDEACKLHPSNQHAYSNSKKAESRLEQSSQEQCRIL